LENTLEEARRRVAEEEARRFVKQEEARRKVAEEEAQRFAEGEDERKKALQEQEKAEARQRELEEEDSSQEEDEPRWNPLSKFPWKKAAPRIIEDEADMLDMDKRCIDAFLESVRPCTWRDPVRTPIKGTNLYTRFMLPCRPSGTRVNVKDSSFITLGNFLKFLEDEGLLCLKPGLTDPVVTSIRREACRGYKYVPRSKCLSDTSIAPAKERSAVSHIGKFLWR
jgi:hypothetical protein